MKKLRWGVLGTGRIVSKMGRAIQRSGRAEWVGVAGRVMENSRIAAQEYSVPKAYASYQELIDDPEIDVVYIALLNHLHKKWMIKAIQAGKHVLCEKPFTLNTKEALEVQEVAAKHNVQIMEAFVWRFHPAHLYAKEWIRSGKIGDTIMMNAHFSIAINQEESTRMVSEWGGGSLYDIGSYPVSWSRFFMEDEPLEVDAKLDFHPQQRVDMRCIGSLYFSGGRSAQISSAFDMQNGSFYEVLGSKGKVRVDFEVEPEAMTLTVTSGQEKKEWTTDRIEQYQLQVDAFSTAIVTGKTLPYGVKDAICNMRVIDALFAADQSKRRVKV